LAYELPDGGLAIMTLAGGDVDTITLEEAWEPDWSGANGLILYRGGNPYGLWVYHPDTKEHVFLTDQGFDDGAVWASNGQEIIAQGESSGLVVLGYPGGAVSLIPCLEPDQTGCAGEDPSGSPDGQWIAFDDGAVEKVPRLGGTSSYVTTYDQGGSYPSWSPDGRWIAFVNYEMDSGNIWVTDSRGSSFGLVQITEGPYYDASPNWAPGSDEIYFASDRSGSEEIWKVPFDPNAVPVQPTSWGRLKARDW